MSPVSSQAVGIARRVNRQVVREQLLAVVGHGCATSAAQTAGTWLMHAPSAGSPSPSIPQLACMGRRISLQRVRNSTLR